MAGEGSTSEKLNHTLFTFIKILRDNNINDWFVAYGTLLGIVREKSCIENDDDIDIIINKKYRDKIKELLIKYNFKIDNEGIIKNSNKILKTKTDENYVTIDFYCAQVNNFGSFYDPWEDVKWSRCYKDKKSKTFEEIEWKGLIVNIPSNFETKLEGRYGENWKIPQNNKGFKKKKNKKFVL